RRHCNGINCKVRACGVNWASHAQRFLYFREPALGQVRSLRRVAAHSVPECHGVGGEPHHPALPKPGAILRRMNNAAAGGDDMTLQPRHFVEDLDLEPAKFRLAVVLENAAYRFPQAAFENLIRIAPVPTELRRYQGRYHGLAGAAIAYKEEA